MGETGDALQNLVRGSGPNEGFGIFVVHLDVLADGRFQVVYASEHATSNSLVGEFGEPSLHQVDKEPYVGVKWT